MTITYPINVAINESITSTIQAGSSESTLVNGLLNWAELDEASGNSRECKVSSVSLAETSGSVGTGTGPDGNNAVQFDGTSFLEDTTVDGSMFSDDDAESTEAIWVYLPATQTATTIFCASGNDADNQESRVQVNNNSLGQRTKNNSGNVHNIIVNGGPPFLSSTTWFCLFLVNTGTSRDTYYNGEASANASTAHTDTGTAPASSALRVGANQSGSSVNQNGVRVAKWARWNRVLTEAERLEFYNNGSGIAYPG